MEPMLPITAIYAGIAGIMLLVLSYQVVVKRQRYKVGLGDAQNEEITVAIRAQANFVEYVPIALILMAFAELNGGSAWLLHIFGAVLILARAAHAWGFVASSGKLHIGRYHGTLWTWVTLLALALWNIWIVIAAA